MMTKRILSFLTGILLIILVVFLGYKARNQSYIVPFGLASAILAPLGITAIGYAITAKSRHKSRQTLELLAKVPELKRLTSEASTQEEKLRSLEQQQSRVIEIIKFEARKQALLTRREALRPYAVHLLHELKSIDSEISALEIDIESRIERDTEFERLIVEIERFLALLGNQENNDTPVSFGPD